MDLISAKNFLILQAIFIGIGAIYLRRRVPHSGVRLRLRGGRAGGSAKSVAVPEAGPVQKAQSEPSPSTPPKIERALNIYFNFNGHSWDAYEVLGLPAGSSLEKAKAAFVEATKNTSEASVEFYQVALSAIEQHLEKLR